MDMSANAALGVPVRGIDSGPRAAAAGPDRQPGFSDLLARLATAGEDKGSTPSGPQPGLSEAGTENSASAPANLEPEVADLLAKLAAIGAPAATQEASAQSLNGDDDASDLEALMATETASKTDAKELAPDTEDQLPTGTSPTAASAQQAAFLTMAASASGALLRPLAAATPDTGAAQAQGDLPNATPGLQLPGADAAPKGAPDATMPGFAAAAAGPRIAVLGQETHIAPAQVLQIAPQPGATPEQGAKAGRGKGDAEPPPTRTAAPASGRPGEQVQGPSAWDAKSGGEEGADGDGNGNGNGNEDRASSHPGVSTDSAIGSVAKDGARAFGAAPSPMQQVAGRIVAAALGAQPDGGSIDGGSMRAVSSPVIKVLHLELQPADLGTITIRMSLKQDGLDIRLEASRHDTAAMLQRDQEGLAKLLSSAGYRMDGMTVTASAAHGSLGSTQGADGQASAFQPFQSSDQGGSSQPDARSSGERQSAPSDPRTFSGKQHDDSDTRDPARSIGGDLYV